MSFRKRKPQRPLWVEREKLTIRSLQAFNVEPPWAGEHAVDERAARTWKHVRADGALAPSQPA